MSTFIDIGSEKSQVIFLYECIICGDQFDLEKGNMVKSETIGDKVCVCGKHKELTVEDEIAIQTSLKRTLESPEGRITVNGREVKKTVYTEKIEKHERDIAPRRKKLCLILR